jgi:uncharacterized OsmC-like protein
MTIPRAATAPPRPKRTLRCRTVADGGFKHHNHIRDLAPLLLEERFGTSEIGGVASPSETLLAALGSCLSARIHANAAAGGILVTRLELVVEVDVGASHLWERAGGEPTPVGFEAIRVVVHMVADGSAEAIRALVAHAVLWSPIANTLHDPVHLDVTVADAP